MFNQRGEGGDTSIDTLVGPGSKITGDIRFKAGLHVDGAVEGGVFADGPAVLVISDQGRIEGRVEVPTVVVDGQLDGDVVAADRVELRPNARVRGNIEYGSIKMALGAQVNGKLASLPRKAPAGQSQPARAEAKAAG